MSCSWSWGWAVFGLDKEPAPQEAGSSTPYGAIAVLGRAQLEFVGWGVRFRSV